MWHGELVKVWVKMVLDVVRFWERGCHPIDFGNRGLVNNLMYTCTSVQHCGSQWLKNNSFTKPLKLLVAKLHSSFEMLSKKKNRSAYIWKFFDRSHYETTLMICLAWLIQGYLGRSPCVIDLEKTNVWSIINVSIIC